MAILSEAKIVESVYKYDPEFNVNITCGTDVQDIDITELKTDIQAFKQYLLDRYYKKDETKAWYKFWKK